MFKGIVKLIVVIVSAGAIWWWMGTSEEEVARVEVEEVSYEEGVEEVEEEVKGGEIAQEAVEIEEEVIEEDAPAENIIEDIQPDDEDRYPATYNLAVPFTPQAPFANWDLPYQEACEEASAYMVWMYYQGEPSGLINPNDADEAIWELVDFQTDLLGTYMDTTVEETREFIDLFYGLAATVVDDPTVEQIKTEIAEGRPVIVPAAGRKLGNPYFSGDGPLYHMIVIKGYTETQFIVNDPGTKRGQDYVYDIDVVMEAMGDWNDGDPANGAKRVILLAP